ncbi:uracil-xanthine permease family protein [Propionibacteriaceae bacterium Y1923]|uniref:uracil-xanthine permease family protein n=1 Tax=Aestuariimicrobium sp. Y1814 TaxID=3418742 RepID=UPI003C1F9438
MAIWKLHGDGKIAGPDDVVPPHERLSWGRTIGLGAQHVVAMFGATFVFPIIMGLNPQLAIMMSGVATILFLLIVRGKVPSYLGTSAAFVGGVVAIYAGGGTPQQVTGAIFVSALVLTLVGVFIHFVGAAVLTKVLPPVVTGAVVMLIGFNLAPVVASVYWPQDQWVGFAVMFVVILLSVGLRGFLGRISIFIGLIFGYVLSWVLDLTMGQITSYNAGTGEVDTHWRVDWSGVMTADWFGLPPATDNAAGIVGWHLPEFSFNFTLLVLPAVIALVAENVGHVKAVAEMTGENLDNKMGAAVAADGVGSAVATFFGGSPTTTYAENIGVMASTRVYSTAAYTVAALVAILFGFSPKFGAVISATPGGVLGGITVVLYGMIGLLGAKIWKENKVDFANPLNLVPISAGIIIAIGDVSLRFTDDFVLSGISLGTIVTVGMYHLARLVAPQHLKDRADSELTVEDNVLIADPTGHQALENLGLEDDHGAAARRRAAQDDPTQ